MAREQSQWKLEAHKARSDTKDGSLGGTGTVLQVSLGPSATDRHLRINLYPHVTDETISRGKGKSTAYS